ncbi:hypothetical protein IC575_005938 [Cucumis melo]
MPPSYDACASDVPCLNLDLCKSYDARELEILASNRDDGYLNLFSIYTLIFLISCQFSNSTQSFTRNSLQMIFSQNFSSLFYHIFSQINSEFFLKSDGGVIIN